MFKYIFKPLVSEPFVELVLTTDSAQLLEEDLLGVTCALSLYVAHDLPSLLEVELSPVLDM